jgi:hypothetical protein
MGSTIVPVISEVYILLHESKRARMIIVNIKFQFKEDYSLIKETCWVKDLI